MHIPHPERRSYDSLDIEHKVDAILDMLLSIKDAFPEGPDKHRADHSAWIEAKKNEAEFWKELKMDITKNGVRGLIIVILGLIVLGIQTKLSGFFH